MTETINAIAIAAGYATKRCCKRDLYHPSELLHRYLSGVPYR